MGLFFKLALLSAVAAAISVGYIVYLLDKPQDVPKLSEEYWGPGLPKLDDQSIKPFAINVTDQELKDLKERLNRWRPGPEALEGIGFQYGFHRQQLKDLIEYWKTKYNWRTREKILNSLNQFKTQISGLDIHFIHQKPKNIPKGAEVVPLLLIHGWPGSVKEFYKMIPLLTTERSGENFVFEVVAPSLPGYGWSQGASKPGLSPQHVGIILHKLMLRLGFDKYYVQGGDWGSSIGAAISMFYPDSVLGYHTNFCNHLNTFQMMKLYAGYMFPWLVGSEENTERLGGQFSHVLEESGYFHLQATKPDTVGAALSDSPAGLAAYILEKFSTWTNIKWKTKQDGGLSNFDKDDLLDNVMIYWLTNSITTSMRIYSEAINKKQQSFKWTQVPIEVPTGCARFPFEIMIVPKKIIESAYKNLIRFSDMPKGGHFAAFEVPELLAEDIWQFTHTARLLRHQALENKQKQKNDEM